MKQRLISVLTVIFLVIPVLVFAHGTNYLEFNPDYFKTKPLNVSSSGILNEIFIPSNDFLGGIDFWFDNAGTSGSVIFELRDQNNNLITAKTITIPHIDPIVSGQRIHVDWNSQVPVVSSNKYRVKISSSLPQLQIYYADRIKFLGHNEPHVSNYLSGAAEINGEEQEFSFKYGLYETTETSVPIISNVIWSITSETQMRVDFNANEPVDFKIEYGPSGQGYTQNTNWTGEYKFCADGVTICNSFINVNPNTTYQYILTIKDSWGNQNQTNGTFQSGQNQISLPTPSTSSTGSLQASSGPTSSSSATSILSETTSPTSSPIQFPTDNTSPVISNLRIVSLTDKLVEIAWTTSEATNSHLLISTPFFITVTDASDPTMELEHLLKINSGLGPNVAYVATVTSIDLGSNESRSSISFTTLPITTFINSSPSFPQQPNQQSQSSQTSQTGQSSQSNPPNQTNQSDQNQLNQVTISSSGSGGYVQWDKPLGGGASNGYRVDIFDKEGKLEKTVMVPSNAYNAKVPNLKDGEYSVIVYANNNGVFEKIDQPAQLKIGEPSFTKRLLAFWWALMPLLAGLGYVFWKNFKNRLSRAQATN